LRGPTAFCYLEQRWFEAHLQAFMKLRLRPKIDPPSECQSIKNTFANPHCFVLYSTLRLSLRNANSRIKFQYLLPNFHQYHWGRNSKLGLEDCIVIGSDALTIVEGTHQPAWLFLITECEICEEDAMNDWPARPGLPDSNFPPHRISHSLFFRLTSI
jgi:hypothetical protein